jgi:hypothetical protein
VTKKQENVSDRFRVKTRKGGGTLGPTFGKVFNFILVITDFGQEYSKMNVGF